MQEALAKALDEPLPVLDALQHAEGDIGAGRAPRQLRAKKSSAAWSAGRFSSSRKSRSSQRS